MTPAELVVYRGQARQALAQMLATISGWEGMTRALGGLGFEAEAAQLRATLQECYSQAGNLLAPLAPWKDPVIPAEPPAFLQEDKPVSPVEIPDDETEEIEREIEKVAARG